MLLNGLVFVDLLDRLSILEEVHGVSILSLGHEALLLGYLLGELGDLCFGLLDTFLMNVHFLLHKLLNRSQLHVVLGGVSVDDGGDVSAHEVNGLVLQVFELARVVNQIVLGQDALCAPLDLAEDLLCSYLQLV